MGKKVVKRKATNITAEKTSRTTAKKKNKRITAEDEVIVVDDCEKKISSRSSPSYFSSVMSELMPILGERQKTRISKTPLAKWVDMPVLALTSGRMDHFLNRFNASSCSFVVAPGVIIPFRSQEFSVVLGLRHSGQPIDFYGKRHSVFLLRHFSGRVSNATRGAIRQKMRSLATSNNEGEVDDFVRLFICLIYNCIIFPTGNYVTPSFVFPYLDDLSTFFNHAWGEAAFRFLHREMCDLGRKFYMDGCVVGLMALLYEALPTLGENSGSNVYPRLFRWVKSNIPLDSEQAESLLKSIDSTQIVSMQPSRKEEELLGPKSGLIPEEETSIPEEETSKVRRLENVVLRQMDVINALRRECAELKDRNVRSGANEKVVVDRARTRADRASKRRWSVLVNPSTSRPRCKREVKTQPFVDIDQDSIIQVDADQDISIPVDIDQDSSIPVDVDQDNATLDKKTKDADQDSCIIVDVDQDTTTPEKENTAEFKCRVDFNGHQNASDEDRKLVTDFLAKEEPEANVWDNGYISLSRHAFCTFLFREAVSSEIIDVYMRIMQKQSLQNGSEIHCLNTSVQWEVLNRLENYRKRKMIDNIDYEAVLSSLTSFTRARLTELNEDVFRRCRYVVFPINDRWHWFLLVFDTKEGIFKLWNSNHDAFATGTAKVYTRFLAGCVRLLSGFDIASEQVSKERCRQQGETLDCGVFVCMWLNCLAYDTSEIWECEKKANIDAYRVRIAATILGVPKDRF